MVHYSTDFCCPMCCFLWQSTDSKSKKLEFSDFRSLHILYDRYLSSWFVLDVASTVPFEAIAFVFTGKYGKGFVYSMLNMLRLWRLRRVSALFARYIKHWRYIKNMHFNFKTLKWVSAAECMKLRYWHPVDFTLFMHSSHPSNPQLNWSSLDVCPGHRRIEKDVRFSYFWTRCVKLFLVRFTAFVIVFLFILLTSQFICVPPNKFLHQTCPLNRPNVSCYYLLF